MLDEFVDGQTDVPGNSTRQDGRDSAAAMPRYGGRTTVGVAEPPVRTTLSHFLEAEDVEDGDDLA